MKASKIIRTWGAIAAALALSISAQAYQGMTTPKLHINGRNLQDTSGKNVRLFGYMLPTDGAGSGGLFNNPTTFQPADVATCLDVWKKEAELLTHTGPLFGKSHGWYNSFIRIWTPSDSWTDSGTCDTALQDRAWNNLYIPYVQYCKSVGLYVVFVGNCPSGSGGFMSATHKSNMIKFWTRICNTYPAIKSADNVMFELCNEPVNIESTLGNGDWGSSQDKYDKAYQTYMNDIVSAIRNTGADNVIWVPGMVWQARLSMFANYPISGSNIGYSGHKYPNGHDDCNDADWSDWNTCANKYPIIITEGSWNNMNSDQGLRRGTTAGFGNALKSHCDAAGNVSMYCGMVGEVIGNIGGGPNNWNLTGAIGGAQAAFEWWTTYTSCAPTGSAQYGGGGGGSSTVGNGTYKIVARHSGKALDAYGNQTANGTQIIQWTYGGGSNQKWTLTDTGSGNYKIIGVQSGRAVDVSNGGTANGTKVQLWDYVANSAQLYKFTATSGGYYRITPNCATGSCLDVSGVSTADGANVQLWQWLSGNNQQWALQSP